MKCERCGQELPELKLEAQKINGSVANIPILGGEFPITPELAREFEADYPAVDVPQTLREIRAWCVANPKRRKTRSGVLRFVNNWLAKEQNSG